MADCEDLAFLIATLFTCLQEHIAKAGDTYDHLKEYIDWTPVIATVSIPDGGSHSVCLLQPRAKGTAWLLMEGTAPVGVSSGQTTSGNCEDLSSCLPLFDFDSAGTETMAQDIARAYGAKRVSSLARSLAFYLDLHQACDEHKCCVYNKPRRFKDFMLGACLEEDCQSGACSRTGPGLHDDKVDLFLTYRTAHDYVQSSEAVEELSLPKHACIVNGTPAHEAIERIQCSENPQKLSREKNVCMVPTLGGGHCVLAGAPGGDALVRPSLPGPPVAGGSAVGK